MSTHEDQLRDILIQLENLKIQLAHLTGIVESERGTLDRQGKNIRDEIKSVEEKLNVLMYDPNNGLLVKIDRLVQESIERKETKKHIFALWIAFGGIVIKFLVDYFKK